MGYENVLYDNNKNNPRGYRGSYAILYINYITTNALHIGRTRRRVPGPVVVMLLIGHMGP